MMIAQRIAALRNKLHQLGYDGYIIPSVDEYMSEYVPPHAKRLEYLSSFDGSNGLLILLARQAIFFTDGRYLTQAKKQLDPEIFTVHDLASLASFDWQKYCSNDSKIAYDPRLMTERSIKQFQNLPVVEHSGNLVDAIWTEAPARPSSVIYDYDEQYAGQSWRKKLVQIRDFLKERSLDALLISEPASLCWLLNIRASDVEFSPLLLAHLLVTSSDVTIFSDVLRANEIDPSKQQAIEFANIEQMQDRLSKFAGKIGYDPRETSLYVKNILQGQDAASVLNPCLMWKSCKNSAEIEYFKRGHIYDGVAVCEVLARLESEDCSDLDEFAVGLMLSEYRKQQPGYIMNSFPAICGYQENGAVIHYRAKKESAKKLSGSGLLLIDSGGHYNGCTTDITRVAVIGKPKQEHIEYYTRVLKGHLALYQIRWPAGNICGSHLDVLARQYLWQIGEDYAHGTGHGVGNFLSVHEGPQYLGLYHNNIDLRSGMVLSNEPGYYKEGDFGIRIENLMYIQQDEDKFLRFKNLTMVPYSKKLIDESMLTKEEKLLLQQHMEQIDKHVKPLLSNRATAWLKTQSN